MIFTEIMVCIHCLTCIITCSKVSIKPQKSLQSCVFYLVLLSVAGQLLLTYYNFIAI